MKIKYHQVENLLPLAFTLASAYVIYSFESTTFFNAGVLITLMGLAFWWIGKLTLGEAFHNGLLPPKADQIVRRGIYSRIRHPIYMGVILMLVGWIFIIQSRVFSYMAVICVIGFFIRAQLEDRFLLKKFGQVYQEYKKKTWF
jgi:protein-S-isoprenylcysteine O-methyltransferase Ste14